MTDLAEEWKPHGTHLLGVPTVILKDVKQKAMATPHVIEEYKINLRMPIGLYFKIIITWRKMYI